MSLLGKLMDTMRLNPEEEGEDYYLDDDFEDEPPKRAFSQGRILRMMKSITMNLRTNPVFWDVLRQRWFPCAVPVWRLRW